MSQVSHLLIRTATWKRDAPYADKGRHPQRYVVMGELVPYRQHPPNAHERLLGQQLQTQVTDVLYTEATVDLRRDDLMVDTQTGVEFLIIAGMRPSIKEHHAKWLANSQQYGATTVRPVP